MRTALRAELTDEQLKDLVEAAIRRADQLRGEWEGSKMWLLKERAERRAANDYSDRKSRDTTVSSSIFDRRNESLKTIRAINRFLEARLYKDLFGSRPFYTVKPQGRLDQPLAEQIQPHSQYKLREAQWDAVAKTLLKTMLDLGDAPYVVAHRSETDSYQRFAMVLVDKEGNPVLGPDGEFITDEMDSQPVNLTEEGGDGALIQDEQTGEPAVSVQFDNGVTLIPGEHEWRELAIPETIRLYHGPEFIPIYYKDLIFPVNVPDLQQADMLGRRFKRRVSQLRAQYDPEGESEELRDIFDRLQNSPGGKETEAANAKLENGEPDVQENPDDPEVDITELYWDAVIEPAAGSADRPRPVRLFMVIHELTRECIWIDYRANICPRAIKPIFMPAVNRVAGRAYGRGNYEMHEVTQDVADELLNAILKHNELVSDPPKIFNPDQVEDSKGNKNLGWGPGLTMKTRSSQTSANDVFKIFDIPDLDERSWELMQLHLQLMQAESGVTNAAQSAVSELPGNELATGINALAEVASILHIYALEEAKDGFQPGLGYAIALTYFKQDEDETYEFLEGNASDVLALHDAKTVAKLPMNVEITLTRAKRQEQREGALASLPVLAQYEQLPPNAKLRHKPAYIQALTGMGFEHAEDMLPTDQEILAEMQAMQQAEAKQVAATEKTA